MKISGAGWIVTLMVVITTSDSKNVVFLPMDASSHSRTHAFVAVELAKMGHNVWLALSSAMYKSKVENYPGVTVFTYESELSELDLIHRIETSVGNAIISGTDPDWSWLDTVQDYICETYFQAMSHRGLIDHIESLNPDLIILDGFPDVDERVAISYKLNVPFAVMTTLFAHTPIRMPVNPTAEAYNNQYIRNQANLFEQIIAVMKIMSLSVFHLFNDRGYMRQLISADSN
ncbi:unnamed protein product, partial [Candidula unifasciata]